MLDIRSYDVLRCFSGTTGLTGLWLCGSVIGMRCTDMFISTEKYFELLKESKIKGYLGQEKNRFGGESA
jgi:hypothetical protein